MFDRGDDCDWTAKLNARETLARQYDATAEELALLIDGAINYAIYMLDPQGRVTIWNQGAERIKGWSEAEIIGRDFAIFYPPDDRAAGKPRDDLARATARGRIVDEGWRIRKDGSEFLADSTITALHDRAGALRGFGKVVRDVTDQKAAQTALLLREHHLKSILATVPDAMIVMDGRGTISSFSATAEIMFGYAQAEVLGVNIGLLVPQGRDGHGAPAIGIGDQIGKIRVEQARRKDGTTLPIELIVGETFIAGKLILTGFARDLTERHATERHVQQLQADLIRISRASAMGTFAATLAHEINQPLTVVANYLEATRAMIVDSRDPVLREIADALALAAAQSLRAGKIVHRLRGFVEGHDTEFRRERLHDLIEEATRFALPRGQGSGVGVTISVAADSDAVMVDRIQIQQVLANLFCNAVHSMETSASKSLLIDAAAERAGWVRVTVADTGVGLDPSIGDEMFDAFITTKTEGQGLGLSICQTIVQAHGGQIWAEPRPGGGTAVHFCIPHAGTGNA